MFNKNHGKVFASIFFSSLLSGCASIAGDDTNQQSRIDSKPSGANCLVINRANVKREITTPADLFLQPKYDPINISCTKDGYKKSSDFIDTQLVDAVYGNILLGGLIGVAIDHSSGQNRKYPSVIEVLLEPETFASDEERRAFLLKKKSWNQKYTTQATEVSANIIADAKENVNHRSASANQRTSKKVAVTAWGDLTDQSTSLPIPVYSAKVVSLMSNVLSQTTSGKIEILDWQEAKDVNFESRNNPVSRSICERTKVDLLYVGVIENTVEGGNSVHYPDSTYYLFDCSKNVMNLRTFTLEYDIQDTPGFKYERKLLETFRHFLISEGVA